MVMQMKTASSKILTFLIAASASSLNWAVNPHDEYYTDDIFIAIDEAKKRPHHYDYSGAKRYNRTTTQSLDIPRLLNKEMEITSINSRDENRISAADTPIGKQQQKQYLVKDKDVTANRALPINTAAPIIGNPNVSSPGITTNIIAR